MSERRIRRASAVSVTSMGHELMPLVVQFSLQWIITRGHGLFPTERAIGLLVFRTVIRLYAHVYHTQSWFSFCFYPT